jgi:cyclophilin family peptidyl-prolyl cis-trans isomerase
MPTRHRPSAAAAASSSKARRGKEDKDEDDDDDDVPSTKEKLKYFQAKRNRWNAARQQQQLLQQQQTQLAAVEATADSQQRRSHENSYRSSISNGVGARDRDDSLMKQQSLFKGLPSLSFSDASANNNAATFSTSSSPMIAPISSNNKKEVDRRGTASLDRERSSSNAATVAESLLSNAPSLSYKAQVVEFYAKHNPSKVDSVNVLLERYKGREDELLQKLKDKYEGTGGGSLSGSLLASKKTFPLPPPSGSVQCFLKFSSHPSSRVVVELFDAQIPATVENFRQLCLRPSAAPHGYKQSIVHRIVPNFCVQMGDYTSGDGTGGRSIYTQGSTDSVASQRGLSVDLWGNFHDEAFLQHSEPGLLSMANNGPNKNGSQFFVTLKPLPHLDGKHVVFGRVLEGFDSVLKPMGQHTVTDAKQRPLVETIRILDCGQLVDGREVRTEDEMLELVSATSTDQGGASTDKSFGGAASGLPSPLLGAAFGFGNLTTTTPLTATSAAASASSPFSFAALSATAAVAAPASFSFAALSAAATSVVNTSSCDAFSSFRGVTDDALSSSASHGIVEETAPVAAAASTTSFDDATSRTADEHDAGSNANDDYLQHPVSSFAVRSDPPNRGSTTTTTTTATASAAHLRSTPSVPFSFSPSSTITTVDPFSFASSRSESTVGAGTRATAAARANADRRRAYIESEDGDEDDEDAYVPEDDEESYSDETPSTCSEASDDVEDDDDDAAAASDSFRMQAPTTTSSSTFSDAVPPPYSGTVFGAASSPSSTFSFAPATTFGGAVPPSSAGHVNITPGSPAAGGFSAPESQAASPLAAVDVNHSQPKSPTTSFGAPSPEKSTAAIASEPVSNPTLKGTSDANEAPKAAPSSQGFGFGFGSGGAGFGFGNSSSTGATLSFAGIASTGALPAFGTPSIFSSENALSAKASIFQQPLLASKGKSAVKLSFTELRPPSNDGRVRDDGFDDDDHDRDDESSGTPSSSRSVSPAEDSLKTVVDAESAVSALLNRGCLSTASTAISLGGVPKHGSEYFYKDSPVSIRPLCF